VNDCFKAINLNRFIESSLLSNIFNDAEVKLGSWRVRMRLLDLIGLLLGSDGRYDRMSMLQQYVYDMRCDESAAACILLLLVLFVRQKNDRRNH
jgi:hypothetical protein